MFILDIRYYCATLLHPKYRSLKCCTEHERSQCYKYIRQQLSTIRSSSTASTERPTGTHPKRFKANEDLFSRFEDDWSPNTTSMGGEESGNESDEYHFDVKQADELDRYLVMVIDRLTLTDDPLPFWRAQSEQFPLLSKFAKHIHCIPATSASVERQFSAAGLVINDRRTNLNPDQLDNILLVRSVQKLT